MGKSHALILISCFLLAILLWNRNGLVVCAEEISETDNLSLYTEYQEGWYKSWGGEFEEVGGKFCTKEFYSVSEQIYYIQLNDARIQVSVSEYDANGNWLYYSNGYGDGSEFRKQDKTAKIAIGLTSVQWGVSVQELMENGLKITFSTTKQEKEKRQEIFALKEDYIDTENWISGFYSVEDGSVVIDKQSICFSKYRSVLSGIYMVTLPNSYMQMNIAEYDAEGQFVYSSNYYNGQKWKKQDATRYVAISIFTVERGEKYTVNEYKELIQQTGNIGLLPWNPKKTDTICEYLTAQKFVEDMTVGWNLGNSLDSKGAEEIRGTDRALMQELRWGNPYITEELIDYIKDWGIHTIRIPVTWYYNTSVEEDGTLHINPQWLARVKDVVDYAIDNEMYVIINAHHEQPMFYAGVSEDEMEGVYKAVEQVWQEIATYFKAYDEHLIFEGFNEVDNLERSWNFSEVAAAQMNRMNQIFVDTVRGTGGNNVTRLLCVPTLLDGLDSDFLEAFEMPRDCVADRIFIQVHTYSKLFSQSIEPLFERLEEFSEKMDAPVVIGEWGTTASYPIPEFRTVHASNFIARAAEHGVKCIVWDNGSDYGIINRKELYNSDKEMMQAVMAGAAGEMYISEQAYQLREESFIYKMPNMKTGEPEDKYWGTCVTDDGGRGMSIPEGSKYCSVNVARKNEADDIWLQRVLFYDKDGNYITGKEIQKIDIILEIPENACYMRVSMNSPYRHIKWQEYRRYFSEGDLELYICFVEEAEL